MDAEAICISFVLAAICPKATTHDAGHQSMPPAQLGSHSLIPFLWRERFALLHGKICKPPPPLPPSTLPSNTIDVSRHELLVRQLGSY